VPDVAASEGPEAYGRPHGSGFRTVAFAFLIVMAVATLPSPGLFLATTLHQSSHALAGVALFLVFAAGVVSQLATTRLGTAWTPPVTPQRDLTTTGRRNDMNERVAIVVGAGGELGRATAKALAAAGYTVVGVDRNEEGLKQLPDGIRREAGDAVDPAAAKSLIDKIAAEIGPPEVLVNTIGTFRQGEAVAATPDDLRLLMDVNLGAALWLSQAVEPYMRERGKGSIVHVTARPAIDPTAGLAAYSLSKAALSHLVRVLDLELRPHGIRVNAVAPQLIDTALNRTIFPADVLAHAVAPEAVANVIAFLAGDLAAPVSGAIVPAYGA
jgi:NAD(P)-dependent dehydrogenase (short-subunit alcohol dehydrogenase family)